MSAAIGAALSVAIAYGSVAQTVPAKDYVQHIENFRLADQNLHARELYRTDAKAVVIYTQMNGCPIVRNTVAAYRKLRDDYKDKGVEFLMLNSSLADSRSSILAEAKEWEFNDLPILIDHEQLVGEQMGVTRTAEVLVIDPKTWQVVYRGPLDDRVTYERQKAKAEKTWARDALDALLEGKKPADAEEQPLGCIIDFPLRDKSESFAKISYAKQIAPIIAEKCAGCHLSDTAGGGMPLKSYGDVKKFAPAIRQVIRTDRMPPREVATTSVGGPAAALTPEEKITLVHWIEAGAPRGAGADTLALRAKSRSDR